MDDTGFRECVCYMLKSLNKNMPVVKKTNSNNNQQDGTLTLSLTGYMYLNNTLLFNILILSHYKLLDIQCSKVDT